MLDTNTKSEINKADPALVKHVQEYVAARHNISVADICSGGGERWHTHVRKQAMYLAWTITGRKDDVGDIAGHFNCSYMAVRYAIKDIRYVIEVKKDHDLKTEINHMQVEILRASGLGAL